MTESADDVYEFGGFRLEIRERRLWHGETLVTLTPKLFDTLALLVREHGRLVLKESFMRVVWPEAFVSDATLAHNISALRKVLDHTDDRPAIETVAKKGYRLVVPVTWSSGPVAAHSASPPADDAPTVVEVGAAIIEPAVERIANPLVPLSAAVIVALVAIGAAWLFWPRPTPRPHADGKVMLAVLPFENLTGEANQEYFSDGLTEELITQLGRLDPAHLGVIARTSVMGYKHRAAAIDQMGRDLGVEYVLEGSVRRDASNVRITAQLIQVKDQTHLWAAQYDRARTSVLTVQSEIAQQVAQEIRLTLSATRPPSDRAPAFSSQTYEAYDLYLKGKFFLNKRTPEGFRLAIDAFRDATVKDPEYARAYAGLADTYALMSSYNYGGQRDLVSQARAAARRALQLDGGLAEVHTSLALISENQDWDWRAAETEFRRALELDPNYVTAHHWYAEYLAFQGRFDEALVESDLAQRLDPLSLIVAADRGAILYFARQYDRAIQQFNTVLAIDPTFGRAHVVIGAYVQNHRYADALAVADKWTESDGGPWKWAWMAYTHGLAGRPAEAQTAVETLKASVNASKMNPPPMFVLAYSGMGRTDAAIDWLEQAYRDHASMMITLKVDPIYDPLRNDPRFRTLLQRVGFN